MEEVFTSSNLQKLKKLVDKLENHDKEDKEYDDILKKIQTLITSERKIISKLVRPDAKLKHYESICLGILSIIGGN